MKAKKIRQERRFVCVYVECEVGKAESHRDGGEEEGEEGSEGAGEESVPTAGKVS